MDRENLVKKVAKILESYSYESVVIGNMHASFDILARNKTHTVVVKAVCNIDTVDRKMAQDLKDIAAFMDAQPIVVGIESKGKKLSKDTMYSRFSIDCICADSFEHVLDGVNLSVASKYVGAKAEIDKDRLRSLRMLNELSVEGLAKSMSVSKNTIYKLEKFGGYASLETIDKTEKLLGESIRTSYSSKEVRRYKLAGREFRIGCTGIEAVFLSRSPFNIIGKQKNRYEIGTPSNPRTMKKKAVIFKKISQSFDSNYPFFISEKKDGKYEGVRVLSKKKLSKIQSESELVSEID